MKAYKQPHTTEALRARLHWRCRRGSRELDLLLSSFMECGYVALDNQQLLAFERLLNYPDDELLEFLMGRRVAGDRTLADVVVRIQDAAARNL